jgi:hypothetical protein
VSGVRSGAVGSRWLIVIAMLFAVGTGPIAAQDRPRSSRVTLAPDSASTAAGTDHSHLQAAYRHAVALDAAVRLPVWLHYRLESGAPGQAGLTRSRAQDGTW